LKELLGEVTGGKGKMGAELHLKLLPQDHPMFAWEVCVADEDYLNEKVFFLRQRQKSRRAIFGLAQFHAGRPARATAHPTASAAHSAT
jgi:hypothetical protein